MRQPLSKVRFGLCLFDDPHSPGGGWAIESFGTPRYIRGTGDLSNDTTWLTNIDSNVFYQMGLSRTPRLRSDAFLRTKLSSVSTELGLSDVPERERAALLCQMFTAIMEFAFIDYGIKAAPFAQLNNGIRHLILPTEDPLDRVVTDAAISATQSHVYCEKQIVGGDSQLVSFVFHRQSYAKEICSQPLPVGPWMLLEEGFPTAQSELVEWLESKTKPALVEVTIEHIHEEVNALVNYGAGAGYTASSANRGATITFNDRRWMTSIEFSMLSKYADLVVHRLILGADFATSPVDVPDWNTEIERCFAFGIYCENLWTSLTRGLDGKVAKTPLAAWVHSIDRLLCLKKCQELVKKEGLVVHGYGYGRITVQVTHEQLISLPHIALRLGIIAPAPSPDQIVNRPISKGQTMLELTQIVIERRAHDLLNKMDAIAIEKAHELYQSTQRPDFSTRQII